MQLLYFITTVTSQVHSFSQAPSACGVQCSTERLVVVVVVVAVVLYSAASTGASVSQLALDSITGGCLIIAPHQGAVFFQACILVQISTVWCVYVYIYVVWLCVCVCVCECVIENWKLLSRLQCF